MLVLTGMSQVQIGLSYLEETVMHKLRVCPLLFYLALLSVSVLNFILGLIIEYKDMNVI